MRLIDVDKLRSVLEDNIRCSSITTVADRYYRDGLRNALLYVMSRPIVEERKHGHWKDGYKCSECGMHRAIDNGAYKLETGDNKYCLRCGAAMDEEV